MLRDSFAVGPFKVRFSHPSQCPPLALSWLRPAVARLNGNMVKAKLARRVSGEPFADLGDRGLVWISSVHPDGCRACNWRRADPGGRCEGARAKALSPSVYQQRQPGDSGRSKAVVEFRPATFVFDGNHGGIRTATAIGPRVLLTGAHCIAQAGSETIVASNNRFTCWHHDRWVEGPKWDVALCLVNKTSKLQNGAPYDTRWR